jgi:hypothetical protein
MASVFNTSRSESLFWPRRCKITDILTTGDGTLAVGCGTLTIGVGMLAVIGDTLTINNSILTVSGGTLTSDDQHRLSGAIASVTR